MRIPWSLLAAVAGCLPLAVPCVHAQPVLRLVPPRPPDAVAWTNAPVPGVCTLESAAAPEGAWWPLRNAFATNHTGWLPVTADAPRQFFRLRAASVAATARGFTNLVQAYGMVETLAGDGVGRVEGVSYWQSAFEGGPAAAASLSRPHFALADRAGRIYIADKNGHAILRVTPEGTIHTHAGTHEAGFNGEGPLLATQLQLRFPNALWVRADGTVYVLDTDNARVRRVDTNGLMVTLFYAKNDPSTALGGGRCLWVKDDETLAYFGNTDRIRKWTPAGGLQTLANGFAELGNFYVESSGSLLVADRGAHRVYRVFTDGSRVALAGNGSTSGGGDGFPALQTGLAGPRGVWPLPTGGFLLLLHDGAQLWYVDAAGTARLLINGLGGNTWTHGGDGRHFYAPDELNLGEGRSVALDHAGNILLCESDYGFVRRIRFLPFVED